MGCASSSPKGVEISEVDMQLLEAEAAAKNHFKILLLGPGEAGKSTVVKQLKCIYKQGIPAQEREVYRQAIQRNAIQAMQSILEAMLALDIAIQSDAARAADERVRGLSETQVLDVPTADDIALLWADPDVQKGYAERHKYWLLDSATYYFVEVHRFAEADFTPNDEDMIMARVRTSGIVMTEFDEPPLRYSVVDVGGQRSERRKWIHCFDNVNAIIFLVALSGYNQVLFEDSSVNRMHEALALFEEVVSNPIFADTPIFIFLNKKDLFEQMIKTDPLTIAFPEFAGPEGDVHAALDFITDKFRTALTKHAPRKNLHSHVVAARVRAEMKMAFGDVKDTVRDYQKLNGGGTKSNASSRMNSARN
ncbi:unnamed protein product [Phaeothamnion confervicola]